MSCPTCAMASEAGPFTKVCIRIWIPCLQECLVELQLENCCNVSVMRYCSQRAFWIRHCSKAEMSTLLKYL